MEQFIAAFRQATRMNHSHRKVHEDKNKALLGIDPNRSQEDEPSAIEVEYNAFTGRAEKVGHFISWFSGVAHQAYQARDAREIGMSEEDIAQIKNRLVHVSLELGGKQKSGDPSAAQEVNAMANSIPERLLEAAPSSRVTVYGRKWYDRIDDKRITYEEIAPKSYTLIPMRREEHLQETEVDGQYKFDTDYLILRRRRPFADVYTDHGSDIVIFKEDISLFVLPVLDEDLRQGIMTDIASAILELPRSERNKIKLQDTPAARLAGALFETAKRYPAGRTPETVHVSTHYVQGVGEKFARYRKEFSN
jgi:hypothetical protein